MGSIQTSLLYACMIEVWLHLQKYMMKENIGIEKSFSVRDSSPLLEWHELGFHSYAKTHWFVDLVFNGAFSFYMYKYIVNVFASQHSSIQASSLLIIASKAFAWALWMWNFHGFQKNHSRFQYPAPNTPSSSNSFTFFRAPAIAADPLRTRLVHRGKSCAVSVMYCERTTMTLVLFVFDAVASPIRLHSFRNPVRRWRHY